MSNTYESPEFGTLSSGAYSVASRAHPERNDDAVFVDLEHGSLGVLDGVGSGGMSKIAAETASRMLERRLALMPSRMEVQMARQAMVAAFDVAHAAVRGVGNPNVGTTATAVKLITDPNKKRYAVAGSIGDSRAYLMRHGILSVMTLDHPYVSTAQEWFAARERQRRLSDALTDEDFHEDDTINFTNRHLIVPSLGMAGFKGAIASHVELQKGDRLILTTDGVHDNLTTFEILNNTGRHWADEEAARRLVEAATARSRDTRSRRSKPDDMTAAIMTLQD